MAWGSRAGRRNCDFFDEENPYDEDYDGLDEFGNSYDSEDDDDGGSEEDGITDDNDGVGDQADDAGYNDPLGYMAARNADLETSTQASARRINRRRDIYTAEMPPVEFAVLAARCRALQAA